MEFLFSLLLEPFLAMGARPDFFGQVFIGGLLTGVMYALVALGFVLIYKASGVFNFAQGVMVLFAALTLVGLMEKGVPLWAAIILTGLAMLLLALAIEWVILRHMVNQDQIILFMATIGLTYFLEGFGDTLWGSDVKKLEIGIPDARLVIPPDTVNIWVVIAAFAVSALVALVVVHKWRAHAVRRAFDPLRKAPPPLITPKRLFFLAIGAALLGAGIAGIVSGWIVIDDSRPARAALRSRNFFISMATVGAIALVAVTLILSADASGRRRGGGDSSGGGDAGLEIPPLHYGWFVVLGIAIAVFCVSGVAWAALLRVTVNIFELFAACLAAVLVIVLALFFQKTRIGRALRAVADDHAAALSVGISLRGIWVIVWAVAGLVALAAGIIWGGKSGVQFSLSLIALKALPVLILGGFTSVPGAIIGGLIIGVGEKLAEVYWGLALGIDAIENWFAYMLALVFLLFRPQGLFGEKIIERV
jgi:branched-subunit amino acid ABC-type transport system permease component